MDRTLGALAEKCHAFAKALHYKEQEFVICPETAVEALISINNQLRQPEAAVGVLTVAQKNLSMDLKVPPHPNPLLGAQFAHESGFLRLFAMSLSEAKPSQSRSNLPACIILAWDNLLVSVFKVECKPGIRDTRQVGSHGYLYHFVRVALVQLYVNYCPCSTRLAM